jgi:DNA-binding MarR family transcriptional regulator
VITEALCAGLGRGQTSLDETTLTRTLRPLIDAGRVAIGLGEEWREKRLVVTEAGDAMLAEARPAWGARAGTHAVAAARGDLVGAPGYPSHLAQVADQAQIPWPAVHAYTCFSPSPTTRSLKGNLRPSSSSTTARTAATTAAARRRFATGATVLAPAGVAVTAVPQRHHIDVAPLRCSAWTATRASEHDADLEPLLADLGSRLAAAPQRLALVARSANGPVPHQDRRNR